MFALELITRTGTKVAQFFHDECTVKVKRVINGEWSCSISYPVNSENNKIEFFNLHKVKARIVDLNNLSSYSTFVLNKPSIAKQQNGSIVLTVDGIHESIESMKHDIISGVHHFQLEHPSFVLSKILSYSSKYTVGTFPEIMSPVSINLSWETVLSALQRLLELSSAEYSVNESTNTVNISNSLGSTAKHIHIRSGKNLKSIKQTRFEDSVINKMFGIGGGDYPVSIAGAIHLVRSVSNGLITVDHNKLVAENDTWNNYKIKVESGSLSGQFFTITDSIHNTDYDQLQCSGDLSGLLAGNYISICKSDNSYVDYIIANTSINTNGLYSGVNKNRKFSDTKNQVLTSTLDGLYTNGLCQNYVLSGSPTVSKNTNVNYIKYGSASQKILSSADGQGIYQSVNVTQNKYYVVKIYVYIASGTVRQRIAMGSNVYQLNIIGAQSNPVITGWQVLEAKIQATSSTVIIAIEQHGTGTAEFYVDAMQLSETKIVDGDLEDRKFVKISEQTDLWFETFDKLMKSKDPKVEYQANFIDLNKISPNDYPFENIELGDTVLITDDDIGLNNLPARVTEINYDAFRPELTEHTITTTGAS